MPIRESLQTRLHRPVRLDLALRFVWQSTPGWTLANLVIVVLQGVLPLVSLFLMKLMIDTVSEGVTMGESDTFFQDALVVIAIMAAEWQKVALARAFLRNAQLIILDEPTSAMDAKAEYEIFLKLRDLTTDRAAITISHRFSTVRMADRIYVMENGCIIENGTHDELMTLNGKYAFLFQTQAKHYQ
jgi:ABC-type uncharacterized transport system ATPase subunit